MHEEPMSKRLDELVYELSIGRPPATQREITALDLLTRTERYYVTLAAARYELLAELEDPVEVWQRLDSRQQAAVCRWRGWPEEWAADSEPQTQAEGPALPAGWAVERVNSEQVMVRSPAGEGFAASCWDERTPATLLYSLASALMTGDDGSGEA